ncbi:MAG: sterol desaturase family protein [Saprospiraceae bacterium]
MLPVLYFLGVVYLFILIEIWWSKRKGKTVHNWKESLANIIIMLGNNLIKPLSLAWKYFLFKLVEPFHLFEIPVNIWTILLTFLIAEFAYYWYHRWNHELPLLWTIHHAHHSSPWMNLTTAFRINWLGSFVGQVYFLPIVIIGFSPEVMTFSLALSLFYQFFLHTEFIGRLGRFEGLFFNTPSAHRVHHGSNEVYIDKNYGGMLIIFDRLFGTYQAETEEVKYGVTTGFLGHNPLHIVFSPLMQYFKGKWKREKVVVQTSKDK